MYPFLRLRFVIVSIIFFVNKLKPAAAIVALAYLSFFFQKFPENFIKDFTGNFLPLQTFQITAFAYNRG